MDGTLIEAWASQKSFRPKDAGKPDQTDDPGNPTVNFHDRDLVGALDAVDHLPRRVPFRSSGGDLYFGLHQPIPILGHDVATKSQLGFLTVGLACQPRFRIGNRLMSLITALLPRAGDKAYDTKDFVRQTREKGATPHVAQNTHRPSGSAIDARTTRHSGYPVSQQEAQVGGRVLRMAQDRGGPAQNQVSRRVACRWIFTFAAAAYNLVRMRNLQVAALRSANA